ncbi:MAG: hypothetical protein ACYDDF_11485 [Thermoplasmatota archaeon]
MRPHGAHQELIEPENEKVLGTLTHRAWHLLNTRHMRALFFQPQTYFLDITDPQDPRYVPEEHLRDLLSLSPRLFHDTLQSSGSIGGQHRADLRDTLKAPTLAAGLEIPNDSNDSGSNRDKSPQRGL